MRSRISSAAAARIEAELEELRGPGRERVRQAVFDARQMGSILENGDYTAAKEEERLLEDRIELLERTLSSSEVWDAPEGGAADRVAPGTAVKVSFNPDGSDVETFLFGESVEEVGLQVCTPSSPLGLVLSGRSAGERLSYRTPVGRTIEVEVLEVFWPAAGPDADAAEVL